MNSHTKLLALLDEVFGPNDKLKSSFRKFSQDYDERTDEHVVLIEYRVCEKRALPTTPKGRQRRKAMLLLARPSNVIRMQPSRYALRML